MKQVRKIADRYLSSEKLTQWIATKNWTTSRLCDIGEWEDADFIATAKEIMGGNEAPKHRKIWEFAATVLALKELGLFNSNSICLSVAAGCERILFYLANNIAGVVASDIYGQGDFSSREANLSFLNNQKNFAPYDYLEQNLCAAYSNALNLKFPNDCFDFSFCMSSIEHFGGVKNSNRALAEMARVTKPGGYVFVTTEISINDHKTDEVFKTKDIANLIKDTGLSLSSDFNFSLSDSSLKYLCDMRKDDLNRLPHINLKSQCSIFTSGLLVLRKAGNFQVTPNLEQKKKELWDIASKLKTPEPIDFKQTFLNKIEKKLLSLLWKIQERLL